MIEEDFVIYNANAVFFSVTKMWHWTAVTSSLPAKVKKQLFSSDSYWFYALQNNFRIRRLLMLVDILFYKSISI